MEPFYMDELCLVSSALDSRFRLNSLPLEMARRAHSYLREGLQREYDAREEERKQLAAGE